MTDAASGDGAMTNEVRLNLGGKSIRLSIPEAADCILLSIEGHELRCQPHEVVALGQALVFIVSCVSPEYASTVLNYDPASEVQSGGRKLM